MKFKFSKDLEYQTDAVAAVVDIFDIGENAVREPAPFNLIGVSPVVGNELVIDEKRILKNIQHIQKRNEIQEVSVELGSLDFSIEMETGTGKTYVYLRTIHELYQKYGLTKFIILVPSVAIREGVLKTIMQTKEHFRELYGNGFEYFAYDSDRLSRVREFAQSIYPQIMIMTIQSFNSDTTIMRQTPDRFRGESPLGLVAATRPVVIMDEPQNMESDLSKAAIGDLKPLFKLRYSATHKEKHNLMYQLTPVDAYRQGLVKRIAVYGVKDDTTNERLFRVAGFKTGTGAPKVLVTMETKKASGGFEPKEFLLAGGDDLVRKTKNERYAGLYVAEIDARRERVELSDGTVYELSQEVDDKEAIFRTQIHETIKAHFNTQNELDGRIKVLSLFFIDKVDNYVPSDSLIRRIFDDEFNTLKHLSRRFVNSDASAVHRGYFASKKEKGTVTYNDTTGKTKADKEVYDLIMKDKERLLSMDEPISFIFSHSALKEGWDNPNIFQICTLRETRSSEKKRQEIGRGLRLPVDIQGNRVYDKNINTLTVIANESYRDFVASLQAEYTAEGYRVAPEQSNAREEVAVKFRKAWATTNEDFLRLWEHINRKTRYNIALDTSQFVEQVVTAVNENIHTRQLAVRVERVSVDFDTDGKMKTVFEGDAVGERIERTVRIENVAYRIAHETGLTRQTITTILDAIDNLDLVFENPEEFTRSVILIIKSTLMGIVVSDGLEYIPTGEVWDMGLFEDFIGYEKNTIASEKSVYDHVVYDSDGERTFAESLERHSKVVLFAKLPSTFVVETPIGSYNPDWAIVFNTDEGNKLYLVRETKFVPDLSNLRPSELQKIICGERHFASLGVNFKVATKSDLSDVG